MLFPISFSFLFFICYFIIQIIIKVNLDEKIKTNYDSHFLIFVVLRTDFISIFLDGIDFFSLLYILLIVLKFSLSLSFFLSRSLKKLKLKIKFKNNIHINVISNKMSVHLSLSLIYLWFLFFSSFLLAVYANDFILLL